MALSDPGKVLYLVRHGRAESNIAGIFAGRSGDTLLPEGVAQAERAASTLVSYGITRVFTSPVVRAAETARIIACATGVDVDIATDLSDIYIPHWEGRLKSELLADNATGYAVWKESPTSFTPADFGMEGESLAELQARSVRAVQKLFALFETVAVAVTHLANLRCIVLHYRNLPLSDYRKIRIKNCEPLALVMKDDHIKCNIAV